MDSAGDRNTERNATRRLDLGVKLFYLAMVALMAFGALSALIRLFGT